MSPVEFDKLWRRYDPLNGGMVSKKVFIDKITNKSESPDRRSVVSRSTNVSNNWTSSNNTYHIVICLVRMLGRLPYYYLSREADLTNNCVGEQNSSYLLRKTKLKAIFALLHRSILLYIPPISTHVINLRTN